MAAASIHADPGSHFQWWAVTYTPIRTGITKLAYVQASSRQQAAETYPGSVVLGGPQPTLAAIEKEFPGTTGPHGTDPKSGAKPPSISDTPTDPLGIDAIGSFFNRLTEANTWIRVGEFVIGGIIVYVGLKAMFPSEVSAATGLAKGTAKHAADLGIVAAA
jgi:hypothetical protein